MDSTMPDVGSDSLKSECHKLRRILEHPETDLGYSLIYIQTNGETWKHGALTSKNLSVVCLTITGVTLMVSTQISKEKKFWEHAVLCFKCTEILLQHFLSSLTKKSGDNTGLAHGGII